MECVVADYLREHLEATNSRGIERATELFTDVLLAPSTNDRLFEFKVGFDLVDGLRTAGLSSGDSRRFLGSRYPFAELSVGFGCEIDVVPEVPWCHIWTIAGESRYAMARTARVGALLARTGLRSRIAWQSAKSPLGGGQA